MKINYFTGILLFMLAACSSEEEVSPVSPDPETGTVSLTLTAESGVKTRTSIVENPGKQHVSLIDLYIFTIQGTDTLYHSQKNNLRWPDFSTGSEWHKETYQLTLPVNAKYALLAVGKDNASKTTYTIGPKEVEITHLKDFKATLTTGKTKEDIAQSEFFAGWHETGVIKSSENTPIIIELYRRVAGVLGYFKNVPADVQTIQVLLYENQNTDITLRKPTHDNKAEDNDFGTKATGSTGNHILLNIDKTIDTYTYTDASGTELAAVRKGAYVLPKQAPSASGVTHTLKVITLDAAQNIIKKYNVIIQSATDGSTGNDIPVAEATKFPLYANRMYSIGTEKEPVDLDPGTGDDIYITIDPMWEGVSEEIPLE